MSDKLAEAAALLPDYSTEPTNNPEPAATPDPVVEATESAPPPAPDAKALRLEALNEQLQSLKRKREAQRLDKDRAEYDSLKKQLETDRTDVADRKAKLARIHDDPIAAAEELGIDPKDHYEKLTNAILRDKNDPDYKLNQRLSPLEKELQELRAFKEEWSGRKTELDEIKNWREEQSKQQAQYHRSQVEQAFETELAQTASFKKLSRLYGQEQRIAIGDATADALRKELGRRPTIKEIASRVHGDFDNALKRLAEADDTAEKPVSRPNTVTNSLASSSGSSAAPRGVSREERMKQAAEELAKQIG